MESLSKKTSTAFETVLVGVMRSGGNPSRICGGQRFVGTNVGHIQLTDIFLRECAIDPTGTRQSHQRMLRCGILRVCCHWATNNDSHGQPRNHRCRFMDNLSTEREGLARDQLQKT